MKTLKIPTQQKIKTSKTVLSIALAMVMFTTLLFLTSTTPIAQAATTSLSPAEVKPGELTVFILPITNTKDVNLIEVTVIGQLGAMTGDYPIKYVSAPTGWTAETSRHGGCTTCAMLVSAAKQDRIKISTPDGTQHLACCVMCALKLVKIYDDFIMELKCDNDDTIVSVDIHNKAIASVTPATALVIVGGKGCMSNRVACSQADADAILANTPDAFSNPKVMTFEAALNMVKAMAFTPPDPLAITWMGNLSPGNYVEFQFVAQNPSTEGAYTWTVTESYHPHRCEVCPGPMLITPYMEANITVTTPDGARHLSCCPICSLMLANSDNFYDDIHIETKCDNCGTPISIDVENEALVSEIPDTTSIIIGGKGCLSNKIAHNNTCRDALLAAAPEGAKAVTVAQALTMALTMDKWTGVGAIPGDMETYMPIPVEKWVVETIKQTTTAVTLTTLESTTQTAEEASQTASSASDAASSAASTASTAASTANAAAASAADALTQASSASVTADSATVTANSAAITAYDAETTAANAASAAEIALSTANNSTTLTYVAIIAAIAAIAIAIISMMKRPK